NMVSFVCNYCQNTLKKPKLDAHAQRCQNASFSCIDCGVDFSGTAYRQHTSCISEAEKYEGKLYKGNKKGASAQNKQNQQQKKLN
ncbi:LYAR-type C2HC zinc finger-domain-containing protein, partial [Coemansia spiralis]